MFGAYDGTTLVPLTMSSAIVALDQSNPGWELAATAPTSATGSRTFRTHVAFDVPFGNVPMVHVGLSGFDIDNADTARLSVHAEAISDSGFDLVVDTWRGTRVYKVEVSWLALGHQALL